MKEEILGGLKNALARGTPLEQAARSFINAGYNQQDVQEAVQLLGGVSARVTSLPIAIAPASSSVKPLSPSQPVQNVLPPASPTLPLVQEKKSNVWRYILIGLAIVIVLLIAALIGLIAFSEQILQWLKP